MIVRVLRRSQVGLDLACAASLEEQDEHSDPHHHDDGDDQCVRR
jgi:hypothetical protein